MSLRTDPAPFQRDYPTERFDKAAKPVVTEIEVTYYDLMLVSCAPISWRNELRPSARVRGMLV